MQACSPDSQQVIDHRFIKAKEPLDHSHTEKFVTTIHHGKRKHVCSYCGRLFNSTSHLRDHERLHTGDRPFKCTICEKTFVQKSNLRQHLKFIHQRGSEEKHIGKRKMSDGQLPYRSECRPHICEVCGNSFTKLSHLKDHIRLHTGERPFECSICGKRFVQKSHMKSHLRVHLEVNINKRTYSKVKCVTTSTAVMDQQQFTIKEKNTVSMPYRHSSLIPYNSKTKNTSYHHLNSRSCSETVVESPWEVVNIGNSKIRAPDEGMPTVGTHQQPKDSRPITSNLTTEIHDRGGFVDDDPSFCVGNEFFASSECPSMVKTYFDYKEFSDRVSRIPSLRDDKMTGYHIKELMSSLDNEDTSSICESSLSRSQRKADCTQIFGEVENYTNDEDWQELSCPSQVAMPPKKAYVKSLRVTSLDKEDYENVTDDVPPIVHETNKSNDLYTLNCENQEQNFPPNAEEKTVQREKQQISPPSCGEGSEDIPQTGDMSSNMSSKNTVYGEDDQINGNFANHTLNMVVPKSSKWKQLDDNTTRIGVQKKTKTTEEYKINTKYSPTTLFSSYPKTPVAVRDAKAYRNPTQESSTLPPCKGLFLPYVDDEGEDEEENSTATDENSTNYFLEAQQRFQLERVMRSMVRAQIFLDRKSQEPKPKSKNPFAVPGLTLCESPRAYNQFIQKDANTENDGHDKEKPTSQKALASETDTDADKNCNKDQTDKLADQSDRKITTLHPLIPPPPPITDNVEEDCDELDIPMLKVSEVWSLSDPNAKEIRSIDPVECPKTIQEADSTCRETPPVSPCTKNNKTRAGKQYICDVCNKEFSSSSHYNSHKRVHTGERPFPCLICKKSFKFTGNLKNHMKIHVGKDFNEIQKLEKRTNENKCTICGKEFLKSNALKSHLSVHEAARLHACEICGKSFRKTSHLKDHIRLHTGERPFSCIFCDRTFVQKSNLTSHLRVHEKEKNGSSRQRMKPWFPVNMNKFNYEQKQFKMKQEMKRSREEKVKEELKKSAEKKAQALSINIDNGNRNSVRSSVIVFNNSKAD